MVSEIPEAETQTLEADAEVSAHSDEASKSKDTPNEPHEPCLLYTSDAADE